MFDWRRKEKALTAQANRVDAVVNRLAQQGRVAEIESELDTLDRTSLTEAELESWYQMRGVTAFRRGDRQVARARFTEAHAKFPHSGTIAFSLAQEHEFVGDTASMFKLFDGTRFPKIPANYALAQSRYAYLWGDLERALSYVEPILDTHYKFGIADDTFLYLRGMPFFSQTWAYLAAFLEIQGDLSRLEALTQEASSRLKYYDVSPQMDFVSCLKAKTFSRYTKQSQSGTGYERTRAAVIISLVEGSFPRAQQILDSVKLAETDFPWLSDMLLAAKCEAAHRCEPSIEIGLVETFFLRQPLLFEPDHAVNFRVLEYQEYLKPIYRARRRPVTAER